MKQKKYPNKGIRENMDTKMKLKRVQIIEISWYKIQKPPFPHLKVVDSEILN